MTQQCSMMGISAAAAIASLFHQFIDKGQPPAIDAEGRPVYRMVDERGCAVYTIAPEHVRKMLAPHTHSQCPAGELPARVASQIVTGVGDAALFLAHCQSAHDKAARVTRGRPAHEFRRLFGDYLGRMVAYWRLDPQQIAAELDRIRSIESADGAATDAPLPANRDRERMRETNSIVESLQPPLVV